MKADGERTKNPRAAEKPSIPKAVGVSLRAWRREAGLSIREVAKLSGLSASFISLVERGESEIAWTRLVRLTDVFGRHVSDVMSAVDDPARSARPKVEAGDGVQVRVHHLAGGVEMVYMGELSWRMQPFMITLEPGAVHGPVAHSYEELVVCLDGEATMVLDGEVMPLHAGDVLSVQANTEHAYGNNSADSSRLLTVDLRQNMESTLRTWAEVHRTLGPRQSHVDGSADRTEDEARASYRASRKVRPRRGSPPMARD
jgi:quercetin dioxygenase-like cupin family protein